jgi:hypothetical protein
MMAMIERTLGQLRVVFRAPRWRDVGEAVDPGQALQHAHHHRLHVDCMDAAVRPDGRRHPPRQVAGAGADVGNHHAGSELERLQQEVGAFFALAFRAIQPVVGLPAHDVRNFAAHVVLAGAVETGWRDDVVDARLHADRSLAIGA